MLKLVLLKYWQKSISSSNYAVFYYQTVEKIPWSMMPENSVVKNFQKFLKNFKFH